MLHVKIEGELAAAIEKQARREGKSRPAFVRAAMAQYLEDREDLRDVVKRRRQRNTPAAVVFKRAGL